MEKIDIENIIHNTETACKLCEQDFDYESIINILKTGNDNEKQICILKLDRLTNQQDANLLIKHLTNHHGIVREAVAIALNDLVLEKKQTQYIQTEEILNTLVNAVNDVNPNICRLIIDILPAINNKEYFLSKLYDRTLMTIKEADELNVRCRTHMYTKKIFNLYWCMEAISAIINQTSERLEKIIEQTSLSEEYTIREKTAKIICSVSNPTKKINRISELLINDENFYVRLQMSKLL